MSGDPVSENKAATGEPKVALCDFDERPAFAHCDWHGLTRGLYLCAEHLQDAIQKYGPARDVTYFAASSGGRDE